MRQLLVAESVYYSEKNNAVYDTADIRLFDFENVKDKQGWLGMIKGTICNNPKMGAFALTLAENEHQQIKQNKTKFNPFFICKYKCPIEKIKENRNWIIAIINNKNTALLNVKKNEYHIAAIAKYSLQNDKAEIEFKRYEFQSMASKSF
jgi:hypothetical protein